MAHLEPEPRVHALQLERLPGRGEDVAIAGRVDYDLRLNRLTPGLVLDNDGSDPTILDDRLAGPRLV